MSVDLLSTRLALGSDNRLVGTYSKRITSSCSLNVCCGIKKHLISKSFYKPNRTHGYELSKRLVLVVVQLPC